VRHQGEQYIKPYSFCIRIQHAILLQVVRNRVLRQQRRQHTNLSPDPFALRVRSIRRMIAASSAAKLRAEVGTLNLIELLDLAPGLIAHGTGDIDFQFNHRHKSKPFNAVVANHAERTNQQSKLNNHNLIFPCRSLP